ncbi:anillin-like isoform X2 [Anneissia japonica]|nr:anillin-like isoform X2 [Anneissia japonica]
MNENSVSPVKRRAPLAENSQNVFEPKQDCMHKPSSPNKTVRQDMKPDTPAIQSVRSRLHHLAHARNVWDSADAGEDVPSPHRSCKTPEINIEALPPQPVTRKARFAALAADISSWVDDTDHPKHRPEQEPKKPTRKFCTEPKAEAQPVPAPRSTTPVKKSASPSPKKRTMPEDSTLSPRKKQTSAQPSPKKRNIKANSPCKKQSSAKDSPKKKTVAFAVTGHPNPAPRAGLHIATLRQVPHPEPQVCKAVEKTKTPAVEKPQSRATTNQYKAIGKYTYEVSRDRPATLPVPRKPPKETTKRQAPEPPKCTVKTSLKQGTPTKIQRMVAQISAQEKCLKSPENVSGHVGEMAKTIQSRLLDHQTSWERNEINTKIQAERKKELEIIRKRWMQSSGSSRTDSSDTQEDEVEEIVQCERVAMSTTEPPTKKPKQEEVEAEEEMEEDEEVKTAHNAAEQVKAEIDINEENEEDKEEDDDEDEEEGSEFGDDDLNVSDVLGDIDDILNQEEQAMEEEEEARIAVQEVESIKQEVQEHMQEQIDEDAEEKAEDDGNAPNTPPRTKPLTYSVSTYRNQRKKAITLPPVARTVVIRSPETIEEEVEEEEQPTTPKVKHLSVREKVKALNEEVSAQQSIIQQTSQALNLINAKPDYKGTMEEVEAERLLLIATQRRLACLSEIQHLKNQGGTRAQKSSSEDDGLAPCQGSVTIRDIRLPLKTEYILALTSGQDRPHHFFFVLVKHGAKVIASQLLSTRKALSGDCLPFSNMMAFNDLDGNFMLEVEVYQLNLNRIKHVPEKAKGFFANITPKKLKTVRQGGRAQHMSSPGGPGAVQTSNFMLVGSIRLTLHSINTERFMLSKVPFGAPIEGNIHLRMSCHSESRVIQRGFITMFDDISGFGSWHRRWLVLAGSKIAYWKYPDDEKRKEPINVIDLKKCVTRDVSLLTRLVCARPNTFELMTRRRATNSDKSSLVASQHGSTVTTKFWLSADSKEEREKWIHKLNKSLLDLRTWNRDAARPVDPPKPSETDL